MRFIVPGPQVSTNRAYRSGRGRFWMNADGREFKDRVMGFARAKFRNAPLIARAVRVSIGFYYPSKRNDIDGPVKLVLDALQGIAYRDDRQIAVLHVSKACDPDNPRTVIVVEPTDETDP